VNPGLVLTGGVGSAVALPPEARGFFSALVGWQREHGRHGLPWQGTRDPYRVWLSEIMLQQTQVGTVLAYYDRFLQRFPTVHALAQAPLDEVLALWSGLGYYSRARNLHRAAQQWVGQWGEGTPRTAEQWQTLAGVGPSTAAAVAAFCFGEKISILDGNVKRVLTRLLAFDADLAQAKHEQQLWHLAQALLPEHATHQDMVHYTQGLMDLGATLCRRTRPQCLLCPAASLCQAHREQRPEAFPVKTRKLKRSTQAWWWLVLRRPDGAVWLSPRPAQGIWAGLYCFPVFDSFEDAVQSLAVPGGGEAGPAGALGEPVCGAPVHHSLTHRDLVLHPVEVAVGHDTPPAPCREWPNGAQGKWVRSLADLDIGLPAPVRVWLQARWA
jgi:A/G-specific adenine glycosylase